MTIPVGEERTLDELTLATELSLEDLVDREGLSELSQSFFALFGIPVRIFGEAGTLLADVGHQPEIYAYLSRFPRANVALQRVVADVKAANPAGKKEVPRRCITGASYRIVPIRFDGRELGRWILGPFVPSTVKTVPETLLDLDPGMDAAILVELLAALPRAHEQTIDLITRHLRGALDLILFSGHKALLTSSLHLAAVRDSYRELEEQNATLEEAYRRLKELDRLKSNFLATVSHELRTPLTSIIGYSEMLQEGIAGPLSEEQGEFVTTIHDKGEQLLGLIQRLLDLTKLESGTLRLRRSEVDVGALLRDVASTLQPTALRNSVKLQAAAPDNVPVVNADVERLRQVLLNLTENAIKFSSAGGTVRIEATGAEFDPSVGEASGVVLLAYRKRAVEIRVRDTGIGLSDVEKERIFDAFYQVDSGSTREVGGAGLGLSIVKRLVEAHGGSIRVEDNEPRGAIFVVTLPCEE